MSTPAPRRTGPRGRRAGALVLSLCLVAVVVALTWWGTSTPAVPRTTVASVAQAAPETDSVYVCPAAPADTLGAVDLGQTASTTALTLLSEGSTATWDGQSLDTGVRQEAEGATVVVAPSAQGAGTASGVVTTVTADGDLRGLTTAACVPPQAVAWIVGGSAAPGASGELRLTNPGTTPVTATISLYGATGAVSSATGNQVVVPEGETVSLLLEAAASGQERLAVSVEAEGGVLAAVLVTESLDGETPAGVEVLTSGAAPATDLTVPGVVLTEPAAQGEQADAAGAVSSDAPVLRVVNPGQEAATVAVSTLGADGEEPLAGATELVVEPGAVFDVSLTGLAPGAYGVRLRSDAPVTGAVRLVRSDEEYPARSGALVHDVAWVQAQATTVTRQGALALPQGSALTSTLVLTNTAPAPATVSLAGVDGAPLSEVEVPASSTVSLDVAALQEGAGEPGVIVLSAGESSEVVTALVTTTEVGGRTPGTLIAVLAPVADASSALTRQILLR